MAGISNNRQILDMRRERDKYSALAYKYKKALTRIVDDVWKDEDAILTPTPGEELQLIKEFVKEVLSEQ